MRRAIAMLLLAACAAVALADWRGAFDDAFFAKRKAAAPEIEAWELEVVTTGADAYSVTPASAVDLRIDWGDGFVSNYTGSARVDHTYAGAARYTVRISGTATGLQLGHDTATRGRLKNVVTPIVGITGLTSCADTFNYSQVTNWADGLFSNVFAGIASLASTWKDCRTAASFPDVNALTNVTTLNYTWTSGRVATSFPDVSALVKITTLNSTWRDCLAAKSFPNVSTLTNVTTVAYAWYDCKSMTNPPALPEGTAANAIANVSYAFQGCTGIVGNLPEFWNAAKYANTNLQTLARRTNAFLNCTNAANWGDVPAGEGWGK